MEKENNPTIKNTPDSPHSSPLNSHISQDTPRARSFRTLQGDMINAVKSQDHSLAQMIIANKKRRSEGGYNDKKIIIENKYQKKPLTLGFLSLLVLLVVTVTAFEIKSWRQSNNKEEPAREQVSTAIIPINEQVVLNTKTFTNDKVFISSVDETIAKNKTTNNDILHLLLTKETEITNEKTNETKKTDVTLPVDEFFKLWDNNSTPDSLVRSFQKENYLFGFYNDETKMIPFLLFEIKDFDQTLAGMLDWENVLCKNIQNIFLTKEDCPEQSFKNAQLLNNDIRVLEIGPGKPLIIYGFLNNNKVLIITQNTKVFKEIVSLFD